VDRLWDSILLGLIQGLTEFLPISSSGHLALFQELLGWSDPAENLAFAVAVHVGSLGAVLVFVRREIRAMFTTHPRLLWILVVATLPLVVLVPLGIKDLVEELSTNLLAVGGFLLCTGFILALAQRLRDGDGSSAELSWPRAILVGLAQVLAIMPGISRSGATLVAGLGVGLRREEAVRFAFLLAAPAIAGAGVLMALGGDWEDGPALGGTLVGMVVSFFASLLAMKVMVGVVVRKRLGWFALYCALVGLFSIGLELIR